MARAHLKKALCGGTAGVHHALGDALAVKVGQLLHQLVVLQQDRACSGGPAVQGAEQSAGRWALGRRRRVQGKQQLARRWAWGNSNLSISDPHAAAAGRRVGRFSAAKQGWASNAVWATRRCGMQAVRLGILHARRSPPARHTATCLATPCACHPPRSPTVSELLLFQTGAPALVVQCGLLKAEEGRNCRKAGGNGKREGQSVPGKSWLLPQVSGVASLRQDRLRRAQALARGMAASAGGSTPAAAAAGRGGQQAMCPVLGPG